MPGLVKIGYTKNPIRMRAKQLYSTGVPCEFNIEHYWQVPLHEMKRIEGTIHKFLDNWRYNDKREFFVLEADAAIDAVNSYIDEFNIPIVKETTFGAWDAFILVASYITIMIGMMYFLP